MLEIWCHKSYWFLHVGRWTWSWLIVVLRYVNQHVYGRPIKFYWLCWWQHLSRFFLTFSFEQKSKMVFQKGFTYFIDWYCTKWYDRLPAFIRCRDLHGLVRVWTPWSLPIDSDLNANRTLRGVGRKSSERWLLIPSCPVDIRLQEAALDAQKDIARNVRSLVLCIGV